LGRKSADQLDRPVVYSKAAAGNIFRTMGLTDLFAVGETQVLAGRRCLRISKPVLHLRPNGFT